MKKDFVPVSIPIHSELDWKLKRLISLINENKSKKQKPTTYVSIINDCIAVGIRESVFAGQLEKEYNKK